MQPCFNPIKQKKDEARGSNSPLASSFFKIHPISGQTYHHRN